MSTTYDVAIVGAGLSTLSALSTGMIHGRILLLDYQEQPGGFLRPVLSAFPEARRLIESFHLPQTVTASFSTTAVGLLPAFTSNEAHILLVCSRRGTTQIRAQRIIIACGGLEITREQAQIPGPRPAGVVTPVLVHQFLARGYLPGRRAIVYGDSHYAAATAQRLSDAGGSVTRVVPAASKDGQAEIRAEIVEISGFPRLEQVHLRSNERIITMAADTLVYAAGMMANTRWLKGSGIARRSDGAIQVDAHYATNIPGIFAIGTAVAPSLDHHASITMGREIAAYLKGEI